MTSIAKKCSWCGSEKMTVNFDQRQRKHKAIRVGMSMRFFVYFAGKEGNVYGVGNGSWHLCGECEAAFTKWTNEYREKFK